MRMRLDITPSDPFLNFNRMEVDMDGENSNHDREFSRNAPIFMRRFARGEYSDIPPEQDTFPHDLGTFSRDIDQVARPGHDRLSRMTEAVIDPFGRRDPLERLRPDDQPYYRGPLDRARMGRYPRPANARDQRALHSYSQQSAYSHATTRQQAHIPYFTRDENFRSVPSVLAESVYSQFWAGRTGARRSVMDIERALSSMPPTVVDASVFNPRSDYAGNMVFRGAVTSDLKEGNAIYVPDDKAGGSVGGVRKGAYVTNTDIMSTSAVAAVAGEFVARQRLPVQETSPRRYVPVSEHGNYDPRRVLFKIDHQSGRAIARHAQEMQAEVLFSRGAVFQVADITRSDLGNIVHLEEVRANCWDDEGNFTGFAHDPNAKLHNMMTGDVVNKIELFGPNSLPSIPEENEDEGNDP